MIGGDPIMNWLLTNWAPFLLAIGGVVGVLAAAWLASVLAASGLE